MTAMYVTSRSAESQSTVKTALDDARRNTNSSLAALAFWPPQDGQQGGDARMFRSPQLFAAILNSHRDLARPGVSYFWDEIQFYTDVVDTLLGWLSRDIGSCARHGHLFGLLHSYGYLMGAISYLGAEQALCAVFHSIICFSHRETFYYANFSFAGEAAFRLYRQSYTGRRRADDWRTASHRAFFPELSNCRQDVLADMDYIGMSADPSLCNHARKNETRFHEIEFLFDQEARLLVEELEDGLSSPADDQRVDALVSTVALAGTGSYLVLVHLLRCVFVRYAGVRMKRDRKRMPPDHTSSQEQHQQQQQRPRQYHYLPQNQANHHHHQHHHQHIQLAAPLGKYDVEANATHLTTPPSNFTNDLSENHRQHRNFAALKVASV